MRLTILGSGTCVPDALRLPSGYWLDVGEARVRIDCGPGTVYATTRYSHLDWSAQTHQVISHYHIDHIGDVPALLFAFKFGRAPRSPREPLRFVGPKGLKRHIEGIAAAVGSKILQQQEMPIEFHEVGDGEAHTLAEGVTLRALKVPHSPESLAYRIEDAHGASFGYTGDTSPELERLPEFMHGVDLLIAECAFPRETSTPHLTIADVQRLAEAAQPKRLVTVHHYFDPTQEDLAAMLAAELPGIEVQTGHDGLVVDW